MPTPSELLSQYTSQNELSNLLSSDTFKIVSVVSYGTVSDGITDDRNAIQTAINNTPIGGTLVIPAGNYYIGSSGNTYVNKYGTNEYSLKISRPITIIASGVTFLYTTSNKTYTAILVDATSNVNIFGIKIKGDSLPADGLASRAGIYVKSSSFVSIENAEFENTNQGINLASSTFCTIKGCYTHNTKGSGIISFNSTNCNIENNYVLNATDGHLSLYGVGERNFVCNNKVEENRTSGHDTEQGITIESENNSVISKNTVTGFYYGIDIKNASDNCVIEKNKSYGNRYNCVIRPGDSPATGQTPSHNISIIDNDFTEPRYYKLSGGIEDNRYCLYISAGSKHLIRGNFFGRSKNLYGSNPATMGIDAMLYITSHSSTDFSDIGEGIIVDGNFFISRETKHNATSDRIATGVALNVVGYNSYDLKITNNTFYDNNSYTVLSKGIVIGDCYGFVISGNTFNGFNKPTNGYFSINVDQTNETYNMKNGLIIGNNFKNIAGSIYLNNTKNINIYGNNFSSAQQYMPCIKITNTSVVNIMCNFGINNNGTNGEKFVDADNTNKFVIVKYNTYARARGVVVSNSSTSGQNNDNIQIDYSTVATTAYQSGNNLSGATTWDPGSLADGAGETSASIAVTGAALGDFAICSAPYDLQGITCNAYVDAADSVKIRLQNETGGTIDLASGTWKVRVIKA